MSLSSLVGRSNKTTPDLSLAPVAVGNITNTGQSVTLDVTNAQSVVVGIDGTFAGVNVIFEAQLAGGTTWYNVTGGRSNANTAEANSGVLGAAPAYTWEFSTSGYASFRVRSTAWTSGTAVVRIAPSAGSGEPVPVIPTHAVTQSGAFTMTPLAPNQYLVVTAASTNAAVVKATAGSLFELSISNPTATAISVKLYSKATAPTVGTDVPVLTITVAAGATSVFEFGATGKRFAAGIGIAATALPVATDTGVAVAGVQIHGSYV